ncbi:hypothetical protein SDC9_144943 [bioreactor metagenome]|uniref:Uncharacterized protein n=1 Tax=bioreactor metagenome TaxID=1076179 RepID=A0A645E832_9ZZZZ
MLAKVLFNPGLGGDPGMVGAGKPADFVAAHAVIAHQNVLKRVVEHMPEGQDAGDIGRRNHHRIGRLARIRIGVKKTVLFPEVVPEIFNIRRLVGLRHFSGHAHDEIHTPMVSDSSNQGII